MAVRERAIRKMGWMVVVLVLAGAGAMAQQNDPSLAANQAKARKTLDQAIEAMGGPAWLGLKDVELEGRSSSFYHGNPTGGIVDFWDYKQYQPSQGNGGPGQSRERIEFTKKRNVVQIFNVDGSGRTAWEITYQGKKALPKEQTEDYFRRHDHSLEVVLHEWLKDPGTVLIYDGQTMVERHLADKVTLIAKNNDAVTIEMDADTHLPVRRQFEWRDPIYKDKNVEGEDYDDYHTIDGIPTAFTVTRDKNGDMTNQRYLYRAHYNQAAASEQFDADQTAAKIKK